MKENGPAIRRYNRIADLRRLIRKGHNRADLRAYCKQHYQLSDSSICSYVNEAIEPFMRKSGRSI